MSKSKSRVTFSKTMGSGREDGYTEAWIYVDGKRRGMITSYFEKTDPCDWYSNSSMRCVAVEATIFSQDDEPDNTFEVIVMKGIGWGIGGYSDYTRLTTAQSARAAAKRWVRGHFA
jgi:hypothetical protein